MNLPPVMPLRVLALLLVCHFVACAFTWNPKTNRFVIELTLSCIVVSFCGVFTVNWYYVLCITMVDEESLKFIQSVTEDKWHSAGFAVLWFGGLVGVLQKMRSRPIGRDFYGACAAIVLSGILIGFTIAIPYRIETMFDRVLHQPK